MKQLIKSMLFLSLVVGLVFAINRRIPKSQMKTDKMQLVEPDYRRGLGATRDACPHQYPNNEDAVVTVIDSSTNGYGMVSTVTRPYDVNSDGNMLVVYRQYAGENTTHGQLGAGYGVVGDGEIVWAVAFSAEYPTPPPPHGGFPL
jgi:hypothetical protein